MFGAIEVAVRGLEFAQNLYRRGQKAAERQALAAVGKGLNDFAAGGCTAQSRRMGRG